MKLFRKRWHVEKYDPRTGQPIPTFPPESERMFWTENNAMKEEIRLNLGTMHTPLWTRQRFRVVKL